MQAVIPKFEYKKILDERQAQQSEKLLNFIQTDVFKDQVEKSLVKKIAPQLVEHLRIVKRNERIFSIGDHLKKIFIIKSGTVNCLVHHPPKHVDLSVLPKPKDKKVLKAKVNSLPQASLQPRHQSVDMITVFPRRPSNISLIDSLKPAVIKPSDDALVQPLDSKQPQKPELISIAVFEAGEIIGEDFIRGSSARYTAVAVSLNCVVSEVPVEMIRKYISYNTSFETFFKNLLRSRRIRQTVFAQTGQSYNQMIRREQVHRFHTQDQKQSSKGDSLEMYHEVRPYFYFPMRASQIKKRLARDTVVHSLERALPRGAVQGAPGESCEDLTDLAPNSDMRPILPHCKPRKELDDEDICIMEGERSGDFFAQQRLKHHRQKEKARQALDKILYATEISITQPEASISADLMVDTRKSSGRTLNSAVRSQSMACTDRFFTPEKFLSKTALAPFRSTSKPSADSRTSSLNERSSPFQKGKQPIKPRLLCSKHHLFRRKPSRLDLLDSRFLHHPDFRK